MTASEHADSADFDKASSMFERALDDASRGEVDESLDGLLAIAGRFAKSPSARVRGVAAEASLNRAAVFDQTGRIEAAMSCLDDLIAQFGDDEDDAVAVHVAWAMNNKGALLWQLGAKSSALGAYRASVARFGDSRAPIIAERVIDALDSIRALLWDLGSRDESIRVAREVMRRTAGRAPATLSWRARALIAQGLEHCRRGRFKRALTVFDEVIQLDGQTNEPTDLDASVAWAYTNRSAALIETKRYEEVSAVVDALLARFAGRVDPDVCAAIEAARANGETAAERVP